MSEPYFSVVVPAYAVQGYLRACLDSILGQSFADFEVLAVDDCSPDHCGEILDAYAEADPRVTVLHLEDNVGLGLARQAALERAQGRYVLFVDSDDSVAPGSLAAIAERLAATGEPDILVFDYERVYWTGKRLRNVLHEYFSRPGPDVSTIDERPELLSLLQVVWNKAYRRDFLVDNHFRFGAGYYEDTPWTYPTLLTARTIAVLDRVCIRYRQRRTGNILRNPGRRHFDVFEQYDRVFAFLDAHPELDRWRPFLFGRMMQHLVTILTHRRRIAAADRKDFFGRLHESCRRYRPDGGYPRPGGTAGLKVRLAEHNVYRVFVVLNAIAAVRDAIRRRLGSLRGFARALIVRPWRRVRRAYYRIQLRLPVDERLAVYAAYWYRGVTCNPRAIYLKARELAPEVRGVWIVRDADRHRVPDDVIVVRPRSLAYYRALARAKYLVNNVNFPNEIVKRAGTVHVQTHHGTPLKAMGIDLQAFPDGAAGMDFPALLARCDRWDVSVSSNAFTSEVWEHAYPAFYETLESGYPRNDVLVTASDDDVKRIRTELGIAPEATVVAYVPTHRDYQAVPEPVLDVTALSAALGPEYVVIDRAHYYFRDEGEEIERLYLAADILITDFSSAMFDYANLDRPIVVYIPDRDRYESARGTYFDITACPPGTVASSFDDLVAAFHTGHVSGPEAAAARARFRQLFCHFDDGRAAERVVRRVFLGEPQPSRGRAPVLPAGAMRTGWSYDAIPDPAA